MEAEVSGGLEIKSGLIIGKIIRLECYVIGLSVAIARLKSDEWQPDPDQYQPVAA